MKKCRKQRHYKRRPAVLHKGKTAYYYTRVMEMLMECVNASFGYDGNIVVKELNWTLERGDYLCIAGENGSGKSTLVKGLLRLIVPLEGRLIIAKSLERNRIGYLSQAAAAKKDFPAGVWEIVLSGHLGAMGLRPFFSEKEKETAAGIMEALDITPLKRKCFRELSGGQQRRVLLARALCASRDLLVLDEPAAGLDPLISAEVYHLLARINREMGITIVMVSHALDTAVKYANKILHLKNKQVFYGAVSDYVQTDIAKQFICG